MVIVVALSRPTFGQPLCDVSIVRAPDHVRAEIERWVATEPACASALEVRVVETGDGLYVFARDGRGFTRERLVPDATSAGVLVASWAAADSIDGVWLPVQPAPLAAAPIAPLRPPGMIDAAEARKPDRGRTLKTTGLATGALGALALGAGVYFGLEAKQISDQISSHDFNQPWSSDIGELEERGNRYETRQFALMAAGGALAATGAVLYIVGRRRSAESLRVVPSATTGGAVSVTVGASF